MPITSRLVLYSTTLAALIRKRYCEQLSVDVQGEEDLTAGVPERSPGV